MTLLDSAVVAGFLKRDDALHGPSRSAVRRAAADGPLIASVITYTELLAGARLGHHDEQIVRDFFRDLVAAVVPFTLTLAERAAELRSTHRSLRLPDAVILATGEAEADRIITGDRRWGSVPGVGRPVTVIGETRV